MPFVTTTEEELDSIYKIRFKGVFVLTQKLRRLINEGANRQRVHCPDSHQLAGRFRLRVDEGRC